MNGRSAPSFRWEIFTTIIRAKNRSMARVRRIKKLLSEYKLVKDLVDIFCKFDIVMKFDFDRRKVNKDTVIKAVENICKSSNLLFGSIATKYANITRSPPI